MNAKIYSGDREVVASGVLLVDSKSPLKITLFHEEESEFVCIINFNLVASEKEAESIKVEPIGESAASFTIDIVKGAVDRFTGVKPFAESEDTSLFSSFKVGANTKGRVDFIYTFFVEKKPEVESVQKTVPKKNKKNA